MGPAPDVCILGVHPVLSRPGLPFCSVRAAGPVDLHLLIPIPGLCEEVWGRTVKKASFPCQLHLHKGQAVLQPCRQPGA